MHLVFFTHPTFLSSQSMPRFARMLANGMKERNHTVQWWSPHPYCFNQPAPKALKKWLGYLDQYILFPLEVRKRLRLCHSETLFVFADQALGPWVPLVADRPHVIHCHDFLAQQSALGEIPENPTKWSGRQYQAYIRRGYIQGKHFISVSKRTQEDLHQFLAIPPLTSRVVYNGLNQQFSAINPSEARNQLEKKLRLYLKSGYLLHVGGNQWYKNRQGVVEIYTAWRQQNNRRIPLLMIGATANTKLRNACEHSPFREDIHLVSGLEDKFVRYAYAGALIFLFPSLAEGFGWPIAEAMASGCPVITTGDTPMSEVGGEAAFYVPRRPIDNLKAEAWAKQTAEVIEEVFQMSASERSTVVQQGIVNAKRFDSQIALDQIESIYYQILQSETTSV